jgi:hypothetical protein
VEQNMTEYKLNWMARGVLAGSSIAVPVLLGGRTRLPTAKTSERAVERRNWRYPVVTACLLLYFYPFLRLLTLPVDEGMCLTGAARVYHGQLPFRDFFEMVGPGTFGCLTVLGKPVPGNRSLTVAAL